MIFKGRGEGRQGEKTERKSWKDAKKELPWDAVAKQKNQGVWSKTGYNYA